MKYRNGLFVSLLIGVAFVITGCVTMQPPAVQTVRFEVSIDSIAQNDAATKKRYVLLPGGKGIDAGDLQFQEFATYVEKVLAGRGFIKADSLQNADIAIFFIYAIGDPQTYQYSYSLPTWGQTGVSSSNTIGTASSYGGRATYSGKTTYSPTYGITGSTTHVGTNTIFTRFLFLDAYDVPTYVKEEKMSQVWKTNVVSSGSSSDLRRVVPYMVSAMKPYLGKNTGMRLNVEISENDPDVLLLRSGQSSTVK